MFVEVIESDFARLETETATAESEAEEESSRQTARAQDELDTAVWNLFAGAPEKGACRSRFGSPHR